MNAPRKISLLALHRLSRRGTPPIISRLPAFSTYGADNDEKPESLRHRGSGVTSACVKPDTELRPEAWWWRRWACRRHGRWWRHGWWHGTRQFWRRPHGRWRNGTHQLRRRPHGRRPWFHWWPHGRWLVCNGPWARPRRGEFRRETSGIRNDRWVRAPRLHGRPLGRRLERRTLRCHTGRGGRISLGRRLERSWLAWKSLGLGWRLERTPMGMGRR